MDNKNDDNVTHTSATRRKNIFSIADWKNYDYQKDMANDPKLQQYSDDMVEYE